METMKRIRAWPLGPNGFSYERIGRNVIRMDWDGKSYLPTRKLTAQMIKAVRKGITKERVG